MSSLLIAFLLVLLLPLLIASWRMSLLGLAAQGLLMAWMMVRIAPLSSVASLVTLLDLGVVRGLLVPLLLFRVLRSHNAPRRNDVIPPNMLSWSLAAILVAFAFRFAGRVIPIGDEAQTHLAVAATGLLLGLFVLSTQTDAFSQVVGALRIENAIALFELGSGKVLAPLPVQIGQLVAFLLTTLLFVSYVDRLRASADPEPLLVRPSL